MRTESPSFGVLGFGRFGELLLRHLEPHGEVVVHDPAKTAPFPVRNVTIEEVARARTIILAVPIRRLEEVLVSLRPHLSPGSLVADVASVKTRPLAWMEELLPPEVDFIGTHPLFGPDSAKASLDGLRIVVVPGRIAPLRLERSRRLLERIGLRVISTTAEAHDRAMARTQALTHWLGRSLSEFGAGPESIDTHGYQLLLQVATWAGRDSRELFEDMHRHNPFSAEVRREFRDALDRIDEQLGDRSRGPT